MNLGGRVSRDSRGFYLCRRLFSWRLLVQTRSRVPIHFLAACKDDIGLPVMVGFPHATSSINSKRSADSMQTRQVARATPERYTTASAVSEVKGWRLLPFPGVKLIFIPRLVAPDAVSKNPWGHHNPHPQPNTCRTFLISAPRTGQLDPASTDTMVPIQLLIDALLSMGERRHDRSPGILAEIVSCQMAWSCCCWVQLGGRNLLSLPSRPNSSVLAYDIPFKLR